MLVGELYSPGRTCRKHFKEINRVLKPGETVYIGRCTDKPEFKAEDRIERAKNKECVFGRCYNHCKVGMDAIENAVNPVRIKNYFLINDNTEVWLLFRKNLIKKY